MSVERLYDLAEIVAVDAYNQKVAIDLAKDQDG
jgi:hypothetical protein